MPALRQYLLSSSTAMRQPFDAQLLSSCDTDSVLAALDRYQRTENSLEGELTGLIAALVDEPSGIGLGRKTQMVCGRVGLLTGQIIDYGDLAQKFGPATSTPGAICKDVLTRLAQASLSGKLPPTPYLTALRRLLADDAAGRWLVPNTVFPASVGASGALSPQVAILIGWDVLRWSLPRIYSRHFNSGAAKVMPEDMIPIRNSGGLFWTTRQSVVSGRGSDEG